MATPTTEVTSPEAWEEFKEKLDWEGGIEDLLTYGGPDMFPPEVRTEATAVDDAITALRAVLTTHGVYD
jgi:hypothetical protein